MFYYFIMARVFLINVMIFVNVLAFEDFVFGDTTSDIIKKGKLEYQILQEKGRMPQYGECWKAAIKNLEDGCKSLSEDTQAKISLRFTNCFLEMSGHETYNCDDDIKPNLRAICINNMSDRAFTVYTEFYTHSQNICYFLRNQIWHEETEKTIDKLTSHSVHVTEKLAEAGKNTDALLRQQEESLLIQEQILRHGDSLMQTLQESQNSINNIMEEFRESTVEQKRLIYDLFERLNVLQSWILGEVSWFDSLIFYISTVLVIILVTSSKRSANGRVKCFIILTIHACLERYICTVILDAHKLDGVEFLNELLVQTIWWLRRVSITILCFVYLYSVYTYRDINYDILVSLKSQNEMIKRMLEKLEDDKYVSDKSDLNSSIDDMTNSFTRTYYQNVDNVDNIRKRLNRDLYDGVNKYSPINNLNKNYSNDDKLNNDVTNVGRKYNLRSNSRQATPDTR